MSVWKKMAKRAAGKWEKAKKIVADGGGANPNVEDGRYIAQIMKFEPGTSAGGRDQVARDFKIIEGESKGEKLRDYQGLDTDKGISFFMRDLVRLGYEQPDSVEDCEPIVDEINKDMPKVRITVKNNGEFQNVFIDKLLSDDEVADGTEEKGEADPKEKDKKEEEPAEEDLKVGMTVLVEIDGKEIEAEVVKILEDAGKVKVKDEDGEIHKVKIEDVTLPAKDDDDKKDKDEKDAEPDFDEMSRKQLEKFVDEHDLDVDVDSKKYKDDDDLREKISELWEEKQDEADSKKDEDEDDKPSGKVAKKTGSLRKK